MKHDAHEYHEVADRLEIRELVERYFHGLDAKDHRALLDSFAQDAQAIYFFGTPQAVSLSGGRSIADHFIGVVEKFEASTHSLASLKVALSGDAASGETFAVVYVVTGDQVLVRGLRYLDDFVRTPQGWRIGIRKHIPLWQFDARSVPPTVPQ